VNTVVSQYGVQRKKFIGTLLYIQIYVLPMTHAVTLLVLLVLPCWCCPALLVLPCLAGAALLAATLLVLLLLLLYMYICLLLLCITGILKI
jgi:hypothetical protein